MSGLRGGATTPSTAASPAWHPLPLRPQGGRLAARTAEAPSPQDPGVADRVTTGLRPHCRTLRPGHDEDLVDEPAGARRDRIEDPVVASGEPQQAPVRGDATHVG